MTLGALELRVRFQLRRPRIKPKTVALPDPNAPKTPVIPPTGTMPMPKIGAMSATGKLVPKGAITYDKVTRQLKQRGKGIPFLEKLSSLFGPKKK
jgi:hypothetical protein